MTFRSRPALVGGIAVGLVILALAVAGIRWRSAADSSGCPRTLARAAPETLDEASQLVAACSPADARARLRGAPLVDLVRARGPELPPAAWLAPASLLYRQLSALGLEYPDDMSFVVLSAAWHRTRGLPFDADVTADCLRAWNRKMRLWVETVPPGSPVPAPEFGCASAEEIEKGRHLWPRE